VRRKARGFPQGRRQSRFFRDFDATLGDCGSCLHLLALLRTLRGDFFHVEAQLIS
jgi:hypothetical protein